MHGFAPTRGRDRSLAGAKGNPEVICDAMTLLLTDFHRRSRLGFGVYRPITLLSRKSLITLREGFKGLLANLKVRAFYSYLHWQRTRSTGIDEPVSHLRKLWPPVVFVVITLWVTHHVSETGLARQPFCSWSSMARCSVGFIAPVSDDDGPY